MYKKKITCHLGHVNLRKNVSDEITKDQKV